MKQIPSLITSFLLAGLLMVACKGGRTETFSAADGSVTATHNVRTGQWSITDAQGKEPVAEYDSMRVVETGEDGHPMTVVYYSGNQQRWLQYYTTMQLRSEGTMVDGQREGRWVFYHANGNIQTEATFIGGKEEGSYRVFRENGAPYYIGQYSGGQPVGLWEVYDQEGNLVEKSEY
jgi:antitoxin component YwqK of YwqJK toxin-antitoxin module